MIITCATRSTTSGSASSASCQSFRVIIAIPRNSDRHMPPMSFISPMWIWKEPVYSSMFRMKAATIIEPM